jgi:hypothetical protein
VFAAVAAAETHWRLIQQALPAAEPRKAALLGQQVESVELRPPEARMQAARFVPVRELRPQQASPLQVPAALAPEEVAPRMMGAPMCLA